MDRSGTPTQEAWNAALLLLFLAVVLFVWGCYWLATGKRTLTRLVGLGFVGAPLLACCRIVYFN